MAGPASGVAPTSQAAGATDGTFRWNRLLRSAQRLRSRCRSMAAPGSLTMSG
jgi:hypothetical protein